jgi:hypothetical protein
MSDLASFQRDFAQALVGEGQAAPSFRSQAFAIYRNTSARGAVEALRAAYPTIDLLIGDEMFTQVALDYRVERPPTGPVLSEYGADFAAFLARQPWTSELPYIADVARLDRLWLQAFLAPELEPLARRTNPPSLARLGIHPAVRFAWLATPAMTIWQAHRDPWCAVDLVPEWREEGALFTRRNDTVKAELISGEFHHLLAACAAGASLDDCLATLANAFPEANLTDLLDRGFMSGALIIF